MYCMHPYQEGTFKFPCGRCIYCRKDRARQWTGRLLLELDNCPCAAFITLTYNEESLPKDGHLDKVELQNFIKRMREYYSYKSLRYYAVGEYGDISWRPHYHLIMFGVSIMDTSIVSKCWTHGHVSVGEVNPSSMCYVAGYIEKKWKKKTPKEHLGKPAEFSIMSRRPGIGANFFKKLTKTQQDTLRSSCYDGSTIRIMGAKYHLPTYLKDKITDGVDVTVEAKLKRKRDRMEESAAQAYAVDSSKQTSEYNAKVSQQNWQKRKTYL